jgi:hypothetical protein
VRAGSAAEIIRLSSNIFRDRRSPWNKHPADGILHHLILAWRESLWLALAFELSKGPSEEKIQHHK